MVAASARWSIPVGCPVLDDEGNKVRVVAGADASIVSHGFFGDYCVPFAAVADYDGEALRPNVAQAAVWRGVWGDEG